MLFFLSFNSRSFIVCNFWLSTKISFFHSSIYTGRSLVIAIAKELSWNKTKRIIDSTKKTFNKTDFYLLFLSLMVYLDKSVTFYEFLRIFCFVSSRESSVEQNISIPTLNWIGLNNSIELKFKKVNRKSGRSHNNHKITGSLTTSEFLYGITTRRRRRRQTGGRLVMILINYDDDDDRFIFLYLSIYLAIYTYILWEGVVSRLRSSYLSVLL